MIIENYPFLHNMLKGFNGYYVYFLLKNDEPIYIGRTSSLSQRIYCHKSKGYDSIALIPCSEYQDSLNLELKAIKHFKPMYNHRSVYC
jgi:excinuclease UvrABC nuclease subunit